MIESIKRFFGKIPVDRADASQTGDHDIKVATCALLVEMARIDESFTVQETEIILHILKTQHGLSEEHAEALIAEAGLVDELVARCGNEQRLRCLFVFTCADRSEWHSEQQDPARWFSMRELYYKAMQGLRPSSAAGRPFPGRSWLTPCNGCARPAATPGASTLSKRKAAACSSG